MRIDEISVFVQVFQAGSFAGAARTMGMPKATVSAKLAALERRLGVTLIQRTTRSFRPTPAGELYYGRCRRGLAEFEAAELVLAAEAEEPIGELRMTFPVVLGDYMVPSLLAGFLERFPKVKVDLVVTDREHDLVADGIDVALRVGPMRDTSYLSRRFVDAGGGFYAGDAYVKRHGLPETLEDLAKHPIVGIGRSVIRLVRNGQQAEISLDRSISCDDFHAARGLIEMGLGIGYLPDIMAAGSRKTVRLRRVLPDYRTEGTVNFVYPNQPFVPARVRHFIAFALERAGEWGS